MQTFLPYPNIYDSLCCLDRMRLGKQRVEAKIILDILLGRTQGKAWRNHPAVKMWYGVTELLKEYYNISLMVWENRGYVNSMIPEEHEWPLTLPWWFGDERFHASHRSNLLRKDPKFYSRYGWTEPNNMPYFWPVKDEIPNMIFNGRVKDAISGRDNPSVSQAD